MKRFLLVLLGCGLAASWVGCQGDADSTTPNAANSTGPAASTADDSATPVEDGATSEFTLVSLKLPHMT